MNSQKRNFLISILFIFSCMFFTGCGEAPRTLVVTSYLGETQAYPLEKGCGFDMLLGGTEYSFKVKSVKENNVTIAVNAWGLTKKRENGTISLLDKNKSFSFCANEGMELCYQATDVNIYVIFEVR